MIDAGFVRLNNGKVVDHKGEANETTAVAENGREIVEFGVVFQGNRDVCGRVVAGGHVSRLNNTVELRITAKGI
jgi:hypothetical protein